MTIVPEERKTSIARLVRVRPDLVQINYNPGCTLTLAGMAEVQVARRSLMGGHPYGMITLIPEDVDYQLPTMEKDHLADDRALGKLVATAVVCRANMIEMLVKLYFSYFPQMHRVHVTDDEAEARAWLEAQLEQSAQTGS